MRPLRPRHPTAHLAQLLRAEGLRLVRNGLRPARLEARHELSLKRLTLEVSAAEAGLRLDKFLAARSGLARGACRRAIAEGGVWFRGERLRRLSRPVRAGEAYELAVDTRPPAEAREPQVLFEDGWLAALDKPPGLPSQGTLASDRSNALAWAQRRFGGETLAVHRLDAGTSGVLLVARSRESASRLAARFREGQVEKRYLAIGHGRLPAKAGSVTAPLRRSPTPGRYQVASQGGWPSQTDYRLLAESGADLFIEARPRTGRTHQIRVHLAHLGAPLIGDSRYRGPETVARPGGGTFTAHRPLLHASAITFAHPRDNRPVTIEAPLPDDFTEALQALGLELAPEAEVPAEA